MPLENKKFLDQAGTTHLWSKIITELNKKGQVNSVSAGNNAITIGGTATAPTVALKISSVTGNNLEIKSDGAYVSVPAATVYSISKKTTANTGYAATYQLTADGVATGTDIDIPKDMVVSAGEVKTVSTANSPYAGAAVGDKYIELTLANANSDKLYIPANSLVEYVTSGSSNGDMIVVSINGNHQVTATITDGTITKAKLYSDVQTSLGKADTAVQSVTTGDATSGNGTIKVDGVGVAVYGLGSAAYANTSAFDAAGTGASEAGAVYSAILALSNNEIDTAIANASSGS